MDLLRWPLLGRALRWRWGRLILQGPLLLLALLVIYDGLTGPKLAPMNLATVLVWIHYRGGVILLLLLVGNLFCLGCPFTLARTLLRKAAGRGRRWPHRWRNKWGAIGLILIFLWLYEWLDLWANPALTAWLAVAYFAAALVLELAFAESPFCKYLCPLGAFNTLYAMLSPLRVGSRDREVCRACPGKECVRGSERVLGCGTDLYVPQVRSNLDCLLCLDCARACPFDNVALGLRRPGQELVLERWRRGGGTAFLALMLAFAGVSNAFGMVPPIYALESALSRILGIESEGLILALIFGVGNLLLPAGLGLAAAALSGRMAGAGESRGTILAHYAPAFVPLGFAIWLGHYIFHLATGVLSVVPVFQNFAQDHGVTALGAPNWALGPVLPAAWLLPIQVFSILVGLGASLWVLGGIAGREKAPQKATLPWLVLLVALALAAVIIFTLPMEMRGTMELGH